MNHSHTLSYSLYSRFNVLVIGRLVVLAVFVFTASVALAGADSSGGAEAVSHKTVWIDVRTLLEHKIDNIPGDARIPHDEILAKVSKAYPDKNTQLKLYCRSGGRAGKAEQVLAAAGYNSVENIGGIADARRVRDLE